MIVNPYLTSKCEEILKMQLNNNCLSNLQAIIFLRLLIFIMSKT